MQNEELTLSILRNIESLKTQKILSTELGISIGKVNYALNALIDKSLIKAENFFANKQKNQYRYLLTEQGLKEKIELTTKFIARKKAEYDLLVLELERYRVESGKCH